MLAEPARQRGVALRARGDRIARDGADQRIAKRPGARAKDPSGSHSRPSGPVAARCARARPHLAERRLPRQRRCSSRHPNAPGARAGGLVADAELDDAEHPASRPKRRPGVSPEVSPGVAPGVAPGVGPWRRSSRINAGARLWWSFCERHPGWSRSARREHRIQTCPPTAEADTAASASRNDLGPSGWVMGRGDVDGEKLDGNGSAVRVEGLAPVAIPAVAAGILGEIIRAYVAAHDLGATVELEGVDGAGDRRGRPAPSRRRLLGGGGCAERSADPRSFRLSPGGPVEPVGCSMTLGRRRGVIIAITDIQRPTELHGEAIQDEAMLLLTRDGAKRYDRCTRLHRAVQRPPLTSHGGLSSGRRSRGRAAVTLPVSFRVRRRPDRPAHDYCRSPRAQDSSAGDPLRSLARRPQIRRNKVCAQRRDQRRDLL